jgi:proline iminopeptidase
MCANLQLDRPEPREGYIPIGTARLFYRDLGLGQPVIVLHGGPDFDHTYLLPDMDSLSDAFRLIYYDQRGRGKSAEHVQPDDVSLASDVADIDAVREYFQLESAAILGHSFGALLAMEYAIRYPYRVSHLIVMNTAPASYGDWNLMRAARDANAPADLQQVREMAASPGYLEGDPDAVSARYRVHFRSTLRPPELFEGLMRRMRASFTKEGILKARAIEDRLDAETVDSSDFDLLPRLTGLRIPTLVIHGDYDFCPRECSAHVAEAIPGARLVELRGCGHFSYLECPERVRTEVSGFLQGA